jgi:hypothetical protein
VRYDAVYATLFKCSSRRIADYPHLSAWMRDVWQLPLPWSSLQVGPGGLGRGAGSLGRGRLGPARRSRWCPRSAAVPCPLPPLAPATSSRLPIHPRQPTPTHPPPARPPAPPRRAQIRDTIDIDAARHSYFTNLFPLNPGGIVPAGPSAADLRLDAPAGRGPAEPAAVFHMRA